MKKTTTKDFLHLLEMHSKFLKKKKPAAKKAGARLLFKVPEEVNAQDFIEELSAKHQHYVFFSENEKLLSDKSIVRI